MDTYFFRVSAVPSPCQGPGSGRWWPAEATAATTTHSSAVAASSRINIYGTLQKIYSIITADFSSDFTVCVARGREMQRVAVNYGLCCVVWCSVGGCCYVSPLRLLHSRWGGGGGATAESVNLYNISIQFHVTTSTTRTFVGVIILAAVSITAADAACSSPGGNP